MKKRVSSVIIAAAVWAMTVQAQTPAPTPATLTNRVQVNWSDPLRPGLVRVSGVAGSVSVRTHAGKDVIVESSGFPSSPGRGRPSPNTEGLTLISPAGRGLVISEAGNVLTVSNPNWGNNTQLDIQVPVKTNLKLTLTNGRAITVDGVDGEIDINNMSGDVRLTDVAGSVVVSAHNGNIFATIRELTSNKPTSFASFNSNVDVTLPPATKANLRLRSDNGETWSDFQIQAVSTSSSTQNSNRNGRQYYQSSRMVSGTINGGGTDIAIQTFNGNIYLRKGK